MEFRILGPFEVRDGERTVALGGRKQRALLAVLLLHANEVVSRDQLIDELWGEAPPKSAPDIVRVFVSRLRKALEPNAAGDCGYRILQTRPTGYMLVVELDRLDVRIFEKRFADAERARAKGEPAAAAELLGEAVTLWRGPPLADFTYEPFAQTEIAHLEELRLAAVEERIDADLACGRHADLVFELESFVREQPDRERLRGQLMLALYRSGRQTDALEVYRQTRQTLVDELGIEPTPALRELEAAILRQDRTLDPPSAAQSTPPRLETRKTVTVLGTSLAATGADGRRLDPEASRRLRRRWRDVVARAALVYGGIAENVAGEAAIAVFGVPHAHEDDSIRALRTAHDLRERLSSFGDQAAREDGSRLEVGIAVATDEVIVGGGADTALVDGEVVGLSIRLAEMAGADEVILDDATRERSSSAFAVDLLPPLTVKGRRDPVTVWRLGRPKATRSPVLRRFDAPMVGRDGELEELRRSLRRVSGRARAELVTVVGEPGIGKSRLAHELATAVGAEAQVLVGRCLPYGEGITFWPLREIVDGAAGGLSIAQLQDLFDGEEDADVVAGVRGSLGLAAPPEGSGETFWAFRRLFERLADGRALVAVFEDVHWAEPTLLDLVEQLADSLTETPVLFVCLARPDLLEERPGWGSESAITIRLEPLAEEDTEALVAVLAGGSFPHPGGAAQVAERAEGNPLFVEQIVAMIADAEVIDVEQAVPPTIHALLAARLDALGPGERAVVERAAVVGREFAEDAVIALLPPDARPHGVRYVDALVRKQFLRSSASVGGERRLRFRHVLIQDVAYRAIPKQLRADLHERVGTRLERMTAADALDEIIGYHLEQAFRYRAELGDQDWKLARRSARFLGACGKRALLTGDAPAAVNLLSRATLLLPGEDLLRLALLLDLAEALTQAGELARADEVLVEAGDAAKTAGDRRAQLRAAVVRAPLQVRLGDPGTAAGRRRLVRTSISELERLADRVGLVLAWRSLGELESTRARARTAFTHALRHAEEVEDEREQAELRIAIGKTMIFDATPVDEAIHAIEHNLAWARSKGFRKAEGECLGGLAHLYAMANRFARARALAAQQKRIFEDFGQRFMAARFAFAVGSVEILAHDLPAAEREFLAGYELFGAMGEQSQSASFAAMIARVVYDQGRYDEAELWAETAAVAPARDAPVRTPPWFSRTVQAKVLARRGELEHAESVARAALADHEGSDEIEQRAMLLMDLAEILALAGRSDEAVPVVEEATRLYDRKRHVVSARDARAFMRELASTQPVVDAG